MQDSEELIVSAAVREDSEVLGKLFDDYRVFYRWESDLQGSRRFIEDRIADGSTRLFIARIGNRAAGFVHLLPSFHTTALRGMWILEDLFVDPSHRRRGAGSALLRHAEAFARAREADRLTLTTAHTNVTAQRLYEAHGYRLDEVFRTYHLALR